MAKYKIKQNINGYKKGNVYNLSADEVEAFGDNYIEKVETKSTSKSNSKDTSKDIKSNKK
jgi:hypothetical protein